jgi:hypothetical protein
MVLGNCLSTLFALLTLANRPMTLDTLPSDIVELICSHVVELALADFQLARFLVNDIESLIPCQHFKSWSLKSLLLIHSLWTLPGTKALYRYIFLTTADEYKAFHQSLESYPTNRRYVRSITIRWGPKDFGGPDGYAYKVLGWWYEMEIEHLIRLCPRLESFDPGSRSIVISREGIAALGDLTELRSIGLRRVDVERRTKESLILNSRKLDSLQLVNTWDPYPKTILQTLHQIRKLGLSPILSYYGSPPMIFYSGALYNLRELEVDYPSFIRFDPDDHPSNPLPNLISLTIRKLHVSTMSINPCLQTFPRLQVLSVKFLDATYCLWQSDSLVTMRFYTPPSLTGVWNQDEHEFIETHIRRKNLPRLKELIQIHWEAVEEDGDGPMHCRNILPKSWNVEEIDHLISGN